MESNEFDPQSTLSGQIAGLSMVLGSIISTLPALTAARVALDLAAAHEDDRAHDEPGLEIFAQKRDELVEAMLGLLSAVSQRG